jgi:hypothetical protein
MRKTYPSGGRNPGFLEVVLVARLGRPSLCGVEARTTASPPPKKSQPKVSSLPFATKTIRNIIVFGSFVGSF